MKKVIEELEEEADEAYMWTGCYEDYDAYYDGKVTAYEHAIKIVESGGINERPSMECDEL